MGKLRFLLMLNLIAATIVITSCENKNPQGREQGPMYHFTMVLYGTPGNPFWTKVITGAKEMAEVLNCTVDIQFAHNDPVRENDIIETAITNKVDGLGVVLNYDDAYDESVQKAIDAGIAVICFNTDDSMGSQGNARMAYIGQDLETAGEIIAAKLVEGGNLSAGDHVVCPVEHPEAVYAVKRYTGAGRVLDAKGISSEMLNTGSVSLEETLNRLTQYLLGHKETDAVLALGGMPMEMAPQAIAEASLDIPIAGFDITRQIIRNIIDGKSLATVDQQPFYQGSFTVMQLYFRKKYSLIPCDINTGGGIIDKNSAPIVLELAHTVR